VGGSVVVLVLLVAAAGCSGGDQGSGLPDVTDLPTASGPPSGTGPTWTPDQQAAIDAFASYRATEDSISAGDPVDMKKIRSVAAEPWATQVGKNLLTWKSLKLRLIGKFPDRIVSVKIQEKSAILIDCLDGRQAYYAPEGPRPTRVSRPESPRLFIYTLSNTDGRWLVAGFRKGKSC
jgi:hypothetical protein